MSNRRAIIFFLFGICIVSAALVLLSLIGGNAGVRAFLVAERPGDIESFELVTPGYTTLVSRCGTGWRASFSDGAAVIADDVAVARILDAFTLLPVTDSLSRSDLKSMSLTKGDFGLESPKIAVTVNGRKATSFEIGGWTPSSNEVYVSSVKDVNIYTVSRKLSDVIPEGFDALRPKFVLPAAPSRVTGIDLRVPDSPFSRIVRVPNGGWRIKSPESLPAMSPRVNALLAGLASAEILSYVVSASTIPASRLAAYGIDIEKGLSVAVHDGEAVNQIVFGNYDENEAYALVQNGTAVVRINADLVKTCMHPAETYFDRRLFPVVASSVDSISVMNGSDVLILSHTNGEWVIDSPVKAPADSVKINSFINSMLALKVDGSYENEQRVMVKLGNVTAAVPEHEVRDGTWFRSPVVLALRPDFVTKVTVSPAVLNPPGAEAVCSVMAESVVRLAATPEQMAEYGLFTPQYTIAIDLNLENSIRRNLLIGIKRADGSRYAAIAASSTVFTLSQATLETLGL